jgi:hypothetical protein
MESGPNEEKREAIWASVSMPPQPAFVPHDVASSYAFTPVNFVGTPPSSRFCPETVIGSCPVGAYVI